MSSKKSKIVKSSSFRKKINNAFALLLSIVFIIVFLAFIILMIIVNLMMTSINIASNEELTNISMQANDELVSENMDATIVAKAENANTYFQSLRDKVILLRQTAEFIYMTPEHYGQIVIDPPKNTNELIAYTTYSSGVDPSAPDIQKEAGMLGNLSGLLMAINLQDENVTSDYIATESGIMVQVDNLAKYSLDENGNAKTFDFQNRPWYVGALNNIPQIVHFSNIFIDDSTGEYAIVASAAVFQDSQPKGVVGVGMLLDDLKALVSPVIEQGTDLIIDSNGIVIDSSAKSGELVASKDNPNNLFKTENADLKSLLQSFIEDETQKSTMKNIQINGEEQYVFCAKISSVNWIYASVVPASVIQESTEELRAELDSQAEQMMEVATGVFAISFGGLLLLLGITILISTIIKGRLTNKLVAPINKLSEKVHELDGENLQFQWEKQSVDEINILASKFSHLTQRIQNYIQDITLITAEKERISTELSVATQIQADMLPIVFPPFPERTEFEIYASMTPAKEVGGDFYDFFMLDDDHLAMVIGDVSGKGVPAALFMVISKTLIKDHAQMCDSPKAILEEVNNLLLESNAEGMFVTIWLGIMEISTGKIVAANAGHEYPAIQSAGDKFALFKDKHGIVVGVMNKVRYKEYEIQLKKGDCLFVYTDGVPEATNAQNELYGTDRMILALNQNPETDPKNILSNVRADVDKFVGEAPQFDDLTMLCIRYFGNENQKSSE